MGFSAVSGVVTASDVDQARIKGKKTYEKVAVLSGTGVPTAWIERAFWYDKLGHLKTTTSGSGTGAVATTDSWNIQGWLSSRTALKGSANIFSMSLGYYTPTLSGPAAKYSGDISFWTWTQSGQGAKSYGFTYVGAHRLTAGQYYSGAAATNALSEKGIAYDRNGNVTALRFVSRPVGHRCHSSRVFAPCVPRNGTQGAFRYLPERPGCIFPFFFALGLAILKSSYYICTCEERRPFFSSIIHE